MKLSRNSVAYVCALAIASPFLLIGPVAGADVKGKPKTLSLSSSKDVGSDDDLEFMEINEEGDDDDDHFHAGSSSTDSLEKELGDEIKKIQNSEAKVKRRKLGKGKGGSSNHVSGSSRNPPRQSEFYRYDCEFCGEGNGSELNLSGNLSCFSKDGSVQVEGRGRVSMKDLKVGDKVLTEDGVYEPVYAFGHHEPDKVASFLQIISSNGQTLELTNDHLVYLANQHNPIRAMTIRVGDMLRSCNIDHQMTVTNIVTVQKTGLYAPLTLGGNIAVNDVVASSYISLQDTTARSKNATATGRNVHPSAVASEYMVFQPQGSNLEIPIMSHQKYVDMALAPYRLACRFFGKALCDTTKKSGSQEDGIPFYIKAGIAFNQWSATHQNIHPWIMLATMMATFPFWVVERSFLSNNGGINWTSVTVLFFATAALIVRKKFRNQAVVVPGKEKTA